MGRLSPAQVLTDLERSTEAFQTARKAVSKLALVKFTGRLPDRTKLVVPGIYHAIQRRAAIWNYLYIAGIPQTLDEIHEAIYRGRFKTNEKAESLANTLHCLVTGAEVNCFQHYGQDRWMLRILP